MSIRSPVRSPERTAIANMKRTMSPPAVRGGHATTNELSIQQLQHHHQQQQQQQSLHATIGHTNNHSFANTSTAYSPIRQPRSVAAGALDSNENGSDVSRVQLLLRLMELEKRLHRVDDRSRLSEENVRNRMNELQSSTTGTSERCSSILTRLNEIELSARESEIGIQSLEQRVSVDSDAVTLLRNHVQQSREESKKELREEFIRNINLRNATHHQELVSLMDKHQEQSSKIIRTQELTTQGIHSKLQSLEAKWSSRFDSLELKYEQTSSELLLTREKLLTTEQSLKTLQDTFQIKLDTSLKECQERMNVTLEERISPLQQQLFLLSQLHEQQIQAHTLQLQTHSTQLHTQSSQLTTIHSQLEYASTHLQDKFTSCEQGLLKLRTSCTKLQEDLLKMTHELETSLKEFRHSMPTCVEMTSLETRFTSMLQQLSSSHTGLEEHLGRSLIQLDTSLHTDLNRFKEESKDWMKELREEHVQPLTTSVEELKTNMTQTMSSLETQRKLVRRSSHALQLVEEQFAALQAKVLVAGEQIVFPTPSPSSPMASTMTGAGAAGRFPVSIPSFSGIGGLTSPPPHGAFQSPFAATLNNNAAAAAAAASSAHSTHTLTMHLSDAAGLKPSPTRPSSTHGVGSSYDAYRTRLSSPFHASTVIGAGRPPPAGTHVRIPASSSTEDDFVASILGQK